jgi:hypothetical protein
MPKWWGAVMKLAELSAMSTDELFDFHDEITRLLAEKLIAKKRVLEERLRRLLTAQTIESSLH